MTDIMARRETTLVASQDRDRLLIRTERSTTRYQRRVKRPIDILVGLALILLTLPLLVAVWCALRFALGSGVVLTQERIGKNGATFGLLKFRTMHHCRRGSDREAPDAEGFDGSFVGEMDRRGHHKSIDDPRHTPIGRIIRRFSLDELPQLFNIVKGDMSLVGPRPELADVASVAFTAHPRHLVRPGLTGPYQVSDLRFTGELEPGLPLDANYVADVRFRRDLGLLLRTALVLARGTGS